MTDNVIFSGNFHITTTLVVLEKVSGNPVIICHPSL